MLPMTNLSLQLLALGKTNSPFPFCRINEAREGEKKQIPSQLSARSPPVPVYFLPLYPKAR